MFKAFCEMQDTGEGQMNLGWFEKEECDRLPHNAGAA
jgi:hypothetical protein